MTADRPVLILLNPGPVNLTPSVRQALTGPDLCHREPEFAELQERIRQRLLEVYGLDAERWAAVLLAGSGTAAVEAMLTSVVPRLGKLLVIENGVYGERMSQIAGIYGIAHAVLTYPWGHVVDLAAVEQALAAEPHVTHLAVVHHETTTGRLNSLGDLAALCRRRDVRLLVDGVSSFGAEELDFEGWDIAACAATANKCLHGAPGVSFVIVRRDVLEPRGRTLYLDLATYCRVQDARSTPYTQPVHLYYALDRALAELAMQGGWHARHSRYRALAHQLREGLSALGIEPLLPEGQSSVVLRAYHVPASIDYTTLHDALKAQGFVIYAGQGTLTRGIFRVSTMGAITFRDIERLLAAFRHVLGKE